MTLSEYLATPETVLPAELIFGVMRVADAPFVPHQRAVMRFWRALDDHASMHDIGEVFVAPLDVILDADAPLVLQPDLLLVTRERAHIVTERVNGAPDLVVEILSPNPRIGQLEERVRWFVEYGVREIWLYDQTAARLQVLVSEGGRIQRQGSFAAGEPIVSDVLPLLDATTAQMLGDW